jgi:16S rRNA (cytosine967-C5)-methyltransferase
VTRRTSRPRDRAVRVLRDVLERGARASAQVTEQSAGLSPEDSHLLRELVMGVLRWRSALDVEIRAASKPPLERLAPGLREILEVALYQLRHLDRVPAYAAVDEAVESARSVAGARAAGFVNAVLRKAERSPRGRNSSAGLSERHAAEALALDYSHPVFLVARWIERFGLERTRAILDEDNRPSPLDLMVNPRRTDRASLQRALRAEAIETEESPLAPLALTVRTGNPLRSRLFAEGHFSVQDVASQALPLLLPAGKTLLDLAAAPGGKSFAAILLGRAESAFCLDRSLERLSLLAENRRRLGIREALPAAADVRAIALAKHRFDRVLFDAPCSGTGTLRKNPEIRYRITPEAIGRLARAQREALESIVPLLEPGGFLLYSTCSLEREENEEVVASLLASASRLEPAVIDAPEPLRPFLTENRFQILPSATSDGFTAHLLRRKGAA